MKIYLAGCGQIGKRLGNVLAKTHSVIGLKRSKVNVSFPVISVDLLDKDAVKSLPNDADVIIFTVTPSEYTELGYRRVYEDILSNVIMWAKRHDKEPLLVLVSSTGVYGQQEGQWIDENSETLPTSMSGRVILAGENMLHNNLSNILIVRFSGIYGENRTRLIKKAISGQSIQKNPILWTNRIHEDDCVDSLEFLINCYQQGRELDAVYLLSDDEPVGQYEVMGFICSQLGVAIPPVKLKGLSVNCNKRCNNSRIKALGYKLKYPHYRRGYEDILDLR